MDAHNYIPRLIEIYQGAEDKDSLEYLHDLLKKKVTNSELKTFRDHPKTQALIDEVIKRYTRNAKSIISDREMTDEARKLAFVSMDWALWFLAALGGDLEKADKSVDQAIKEAAEKAGIDVSS